ncbi:GNAT family N-acetyltransferase [Streptococcus pacificus]|uniref:GNAT family N-acetyltransferase n=1 Tax=Streptococcus pacificus TaxID=2740577 RepID=A0ABS0ZJI2_9STRE|nr:GNAT family N-acetyltransferase [Streptococcus pacificus]MBJ8326023.1 GNAT family N-acetyltransferase [Streptococcus pacificus]
MNIRLAFPNEVNDIMTIMTDAKTFLAESGSNQWQNDYPNEETIIEDIIKGQGYVILVDDMLAGYAAVIEGKEPAYDAIYDGKWLNQNQDYITFHRVAIAKSYRGQQIAQTLLEGLMEGFDANDFRCDTHEKNKIMQHILEKLDFSYQGKVPIDGECLAYQRIKARN